MRNCTPGKSLAAPAPAHESTQESKLTDLKRRRFLFTLGAGGASAAVAVSSAMPVAAAAQVATTPTDDANAAYSTTDHVRDYYRTARI